MNIKNNLVAQSNKLLKAKVLSSEEVEELKAASMVVNRKLSLNEQKITASVISLIHPKDEDFKTYTLPLSYISEMIGVKEKDLRRRARKNVKVSEGFKKADMALVDKEIDKICLSLINTPMKIYEDDGEVFVNWFSSAKFLPDKNTVEFRFDPSLKPYLLNLKKHGAFTVYRLMQIEKLKHPYSFSIYRFCRRILSLDDVRKGRCSACCQISLDSFKECLFLEKDNYDRFNSFRQKVLDPCQKELSKLTDISFSFTTTKKGKGGKVTHLRFVIKENIKNAHPNDTKPDDTKPDDTKPDENKLKSSLHDESLGGNNASSSNAVKKDFVDSQPMTMDWVPHKDTCAMLSKMGVPEESIKESLFVFKLHYTETGEKKNSWQKKFFQWCKEDWEKENNTFSISKDWVPSLDFRKEMIEHYDPKDLDQAWVDFIVMWSEKKGVKHSSDGWHLKLMNFTKERCIPKQSKQRAEVEKRSFFDDI